ncbi:methyltransferase [Nocardiopsis sp. MG754419]|uniref:methyltransferase n=1 Tax=Nocardiopsis sp. MG754419 TaxID=2259865 RepID=UPI001BA44354|nr:methyltransferase [Nocardiopsis sp. MG754419]MBR8743563.1 carminomycin 4-O-methyltransferase [Nocardiopsis sp. MG754419]
MSGTGTPGSDERAARKKAAERLWALASPVTPMAIRAVATLRIADHLAEGSRTATELGAAVGADPDGLARVLRFLTGKGLFSRDGERFALTEVGATLRTDHPYSRLGWFAGDGAHGRGDECLAELADALRTGKSAYALRFEGSDFWSDLSADPDLSRSFDELMGSRMVEQARTLAGMFEWQALEHLVDVGGGDGTLLRTLLERFPRPRGTVLDLAGPAATARAHFRAAGLEDRADAVEGSFFEALPEGGDAYLLCWILHDWDDASAVTILRRCAEAAGVDGRVLVAEYAGAGEVSELDLRMLAYFNGRERGTEALVSLAERAGLSLAGDHVSGRVALLEFTTTRPA